MKNRLPIIVAVLAAPLLHAENLFRNSEMDSTAAWRGDKTFTELDLNRVAVLKANPRREVLLYQTAKTRNLKDVVLKFRYKSTDYQGRGLQLRGERADGSSTFVNMDLKADGQWHDKTWRFSEVRGSPSINFIFKLMEGSGTVYFDDILLEASP